MTTEERLLARLVNRVGAYHDKFEATGDEEYLRLACEADRMYVRLKRAGR